MTLLILHLHTVFLGIEMFTVVEYCSELKYSYSLPCSQSNVYNLCFIPTSPLLTVLFPFTSKLEIKNIPILYSKIKPDFI